MGYAVIMSPCCRCQRPCHIPPSTTNVPGLPICLECVFRVNPEGLEDVAVLPGVAYPSIDRPHRNAS
jgi:hypothetical protein